LRFGFVDVGDGLPLRWGGSATEPGGVGVVGGGQGGLAGFVDGVGGAEVDRCRGVPADAGVAVNMVIFIEEPVEVYVRIAKGDKRFGEVVDVFECLELGLAVIPNSE